MLADLTGDGRADIVGFGDDGVYVALGNGDGTFVGRQVPATSATGRAGGSTSTRGSSPTSPEMAAPTSSASATTGFSWR